MGSEGIVELLVPTGRIHSAAEKNLLPGTAIKNKTVGLLDNTKPNFDVFLARVKQRLQDECEFAGTVILRKADAAQPVSPSQLQELLSKCQVVLTGSCD